MPTNGNRLSIDTEFISHGGMTLPVQIGYSEPVLGRRQHNIQSSRTDISRFLGRIYESESRGRSRAVNKTVSILEGLHNVPTQKDWQAAISHTRSLVKPGGGSRRDIEAITDTLHQQLGSTGDRWTEAVKSQARTQFGGREVIGANIVQADRPHIERLMGKDFASNTYGKGLRFNDLQRYSKNHPAVQMYGHLSPGSLIESGDDFFRSLSSNFEANLKPRIDAGLLSVGVDPSLVSWGSKHGMSTGTASLSDSYLITGGKRRHGARMSKSSYKSLGTLSPGGLAHGAGFDAALGASIGEEMGNLTAADLSEGANLIVANRIHTAANASGVNLTEKQAIALAKGNPTQNAASASTGKITGPARKQLGPGRSGVPARRAGASVMKKRPESSSGISKSMTSKSRSGGAKAGKTMADALGSAKMPNMLRNFGTSKWGAVALVGAGAALAAYQVREMNNTLGFMQREKRTPSHLGSDKVAMAMALGG